MLLVLCRVRTRCMPPTVAPCREVGFVLRDAAPKVLFADGMCSAAVLSALSSATASSIGRAQPPLIVWVTSSRDAASTHEGYAQGICSERRCSNSPEAQYGADGAGAAAEMLPYEACFQDMSTSTTPEKCVNLPQTGNRTQDSWMQRSSEQCTRLAPMLNSHESLFRRYTASEEHSSIDSQLSDARAEILAAGPAAAQDPFHLYYTSGTSGTPKAVLLSHDIVIRHALGCVEGVLSSANAGLPVFAGEVPK